MHEGVDEIIPFPPVDAIRPPVIRADMSTVCQLDCVLCPTARGENREVVGRGTLALADFRRLVDAYPELRHVEMGNWGEPLLNPDLPAIFRLAHERGITCSVDEGTNFNTVSDEVLEAMVETGCLRVRVALDGATSRSYATYRRGGDLKTVIRNVRRLQALKQERGTERPHVLLQCVLFSHNQGELDAVAMIARSLDCELFFKINWNDGWHRLVNPETLLDRIPSIDRAHYVDDTGHDYKRAQCRQLWNAIQISAGGQVLGCARNIWKAWPGNAFVDPPAIWMNSPEIVACREALMGRRPMAADSPCTRCAVWRNSQRTGDWVTEEELVAHRFEEMSFRDAPGARRQRAPGEAKADERTRP